VTDVLLEVSDAELEETYALAAAGRAPGGNR
jgi:hypothetical protein